MRWRDSRYLSHYLPGAVFAGALVRFLVLDQSIYSLASFSGAVALLIACHLLFGAHAAPTVLWDRSAKTLALLRTWSVEVSAGCLFRSVPMGIDLKHAAKYLLRALHNTVAVHDNSSLRFFVVRPLGEGPGRVGFMITRRAVRLANGVNTATRLSKQVRRDITVLESAIRAAYPHTPIDVAEREDLLLVYSGGALGGH